MQRNIVRAVKLMLFSVLLFVSRTSHAQNAPTLHEHQFVYAMPEGYVNPGIGANGVQIIERELATMHHRFFVINVQEMQMNGEDANLEATHLIDRIIAEWRVQNPQIFTPESSLFVIIWGPSPIRKSRLNAGSRWVTELGLGAEQMVAYTHIFGRYMHNTPEDPTSGIINTARSLDTYIFNQIDPVQIEARRVEAERQAVIAAQRAEEYRAHQAARRVADAHAQLSQEILRGIQLSHADRSERPRDITAQTVALEQAQVVATESGATIDTLQEAQRNLAGQNNDLERYIDRQQSAKAFKTFMIICLIAALLAFIAIIIALMKKQSAKLEKLRADLAADLAPWREEVKNGLIRYGTFEGEERPELRTLGTTTGETFELYQATTTEIDDIAYLLKALEIRFNKIEMLGKKGWFGNTDPLTQAIDMMTDTFHFDTEVVEKERLFAPQTKLIAIVPATIKKDLADRFTAALKNWKRLRTAYEARTRNPRQDIPMSDLEQLQTKAREANVPEIWLSGHPLSGEAETLYTELDALRQNDPLVYVTRITQLGEAMVQTRTLLDDVIKITSKIFGVATDVSIPANTVVDDADKPTKHLEAAMKGEAELMALLKDRTTRLETLSAKAEEILKERRIAASKAETIRFAVNEANGALKVAEGWMTRARATKSSVENRVNEWKQTHAEVVGDDALKKALERSAKAEAVLTEAKTALTQAKHVTARRLANSIEAIVTEAEGFFTQVIEAYQRLDATRNLAQGLIKTVRTLKQHASEKKGVALQRIAHAKEVHAGVKKAEDQITAYDTVFRNGERSLKEAEQMLEGKQPTSAKQHAEAASTFFQRAAVHAEDAIKWCEDAEAAKAEVERFTREQDRYRNEAESRVRKTGEKLNVALWSAPRVSGPADYLGMRASIQETRVQVDRSVRDAEERYNARIRAEEEQRRREAQARADEEARARRQRDDEEAAARRRRDDDSRSSSSSSSSSSSYDFGGGGSSSGGSDFGGGGSSSGGSDF